MLSYHITGAYPGWPIFSGEIKNTLDALVTKIKLGRFSRIGLRYINVLHPNEHFVGGIGDTNIKVSVDSEVIKDSMTVAYNRTAEAHVVTVRIATPDLVTGALRAGFSLLCDIDVYTPAALHVAGKDDAIAWIEEAHALEKKEFFKIKAS